MSTNNSGRNMPFSTSSQSFGNFGPTTNENQRAASISTPSTNFGNGNTNATRAWDSNSIWSTNGSLSSSRFASRDATRENSRSREGELRTEGKTGSGSLVGSSVKDDSNDRSRFGKRSIGTTQSFNQSHTQRSASNAGFFTTGTSPISLNTSSNLTQPRATFTNPFANNNNGRGIDTQPPNVYTKRDRKDNHGKIDSARSLHSTNVTTPVDEIGSSFFSQTNSSPPSRDGSHYSSRLLTPGSTSPLAVRNPSISFPTKPAEDPPYAMFSKVSLNEPSPSFRNRASLSANGYGSFSSSTADAFAGRSGIHTYNGGSSVDDADPNDPGQFTPSISGFSGFADSGHASRFSSPQSSLNFRPGSHHSNGSASSRADFASGQRNHLDWSMIENEVPGRVPPNIQEQQWLDPRTQQLLNTHLRSPYGAMFQSYHVPNPLPMSGMNPYLPYPVMPSPLSTYDSTMMGRDANPQEVQSRLMYEFKANSKTNKRYELKDIYDHVAEFSGDQHGSRFIQQKLETANSDEKERVFQEIKPNAVVLMTDVFGNYVIQKFFEHGDQNQKKTLAGLMKGQVLNLSLQMYGCRVVQKALEHILVDQQAILIRELENHVLRCVKDQNGNHVVQKAIERCPRSAVQFIIDAFRGQVHSLSVHSYGCRVIQRCLEHCDAVAKEMIMSELHEGMPSLITDQYGNYVIQHVVEHGTEQDRIQALQLVLRSLETYSKHKYASNVVEKCIACAGNGWRRDVVRILGCGQQRLCEEGSPLVSMINDSYGNYVIQKLLEILADADYFEFVEILRPAMNVAKRAGYGKTAIAIEKKMNRFPTFPNNRGGPAYQSSALPHPSLMGHSNSAAVNVRPSAPPLLVTPSQEEPQKIRLYSTASDAVEGADSISRRGSEVPSQDRSRIALQ